jgi:DNA-binding NarL/FixJ family response regulator
MVITADHPCTVVLADDDDGFVAALTELLLTEPRIAVLGRASNGLQAVEMVQQLQPDVVLMDLQMPVTDGVAATAAIRAHGLSTFVIVVSGAPAACVGAALEAGANAVVAKGHVAEELVNAILGAGLSTPV